MSCKEKELKIELAEILRNDFAAPQDGSAYQLAGCMLGHIGSTDPELRDDLIYSILSKWIVAGLFTGEELIQLADRCLDEGHLFYHIGETESDSAFKRSFSVLILAAIVFYHRQNSFLSREKISEIIDKTIRYYALEKDVRGFVPGKGWAHSAAHGADLLNEIAQCEEVSYDDLLRILNTIRSKVCISHYAFVDQEDERMTTAVVSIFGRGVLCENEMVGWINSFQNALTEKAYPEKYRQKTNVKAFLRSLYFRLIDQRSYESVTSAIKAVLMNIK